MEIQFELIKHNRLKEVAKNANPVFLELGFENIAPPKS